MDIRGKAPDFLGDVPTFRSCTSLAFAGALMAGPPHRALGLLSWLLSHSVPSFLTCSKAILPRQTVSWEHVFSGKSWLFAILPSSPRDCHMLSFN